MHFTLVNIHRDETTSMAVHVGAWEVPILQEKHGEERIAVGGLKERTNREWPTDAAAEMARLCKLYGSKGSGEAAIPYAQLVYGAGARGIKALGAAMAEAREAAQPKAAKVAKKAGRPRKAAPAADLVGSTG